MITVYFVIYFLFFNKQICVRFFSEIATSTTGISTKSLASSLKENSKTYLFPSSVVKGIFTSKSTVLNLYVFFFFVLSFLYLLFSLQFLSAQAAAECQ